jgi:hypothetical protein
MARNKAQRSSNTDDMSVIDWSWRFQPLIANEPRAKDGLNKRRDELEAIVEPHVTTRKTRDAVRFKGERRYVIAKLRKPTQEANQAWAAIFALQCLYNLDDAIAAGNINAVIQWTHGFSLCDFDVMAIKRCGWDAGVAIARFELDERIARSRHEKHVNAGKKKAKFKNDEERSQLMAAYKNNRGRRDWLQGTTAELRNKDIFPTLSTAAVKAELKRLGIVK